MIPFRRLTLSFKDDALEAQYAHHTYPRTLQQSRLGIAVGCVIYLLYAGLDPWLTPVELRPDVWMIRFIALCVPLLVIVASHTRAFEGVVHISLALVGAAAGLSLMAIFAMLPTDRLGLTFPGMLLAIFFTYNFVGTRFVHALAICAGMQVVYNLYLGAGHDMPVPLLLMQNFFMLSANLLGGGACYITEYQRRQLFLRERELEAQRETHRQRALHDQLTGLANRDLLHDRLAQALRQSARDGSRHTAYFIDLDGFKAINDRLGHAHGDAVLREVAWQLKSAMRDGDTVARLGGDEFFVIAHGLGPGAEALRLADRFRLLIDAMQCGIPDEIRPGASIGICHFPYDDATVEDVIRRADQVMYESKRARKAERVIGT